MDHVSDWLFLILLVLTIYRVTRLVTVDAFPPIAAPRTWMINWWEPDEEWLSTHPDARPHWGALGRSLRYLFACPWCMSVWVGAAMIFSMNEWYRTVPEPWLVLATASAVTGLMSTLEDKLSS